MWFPGFSHEICSFSPLDDSNQETAGIEASNHQKAGKTWSDESSGGEPWLDHGMWLVNIGFMLVYNG